MPSLWPSDIADISQTKSPRRILMEQAAYLGKLTQNLVVARVRVFDDRNPLELDPQVHMAFVIEAPTLSFRMRLFIVSYRIPEPFPLQIRLEQIPAEEIPTRHGEAGAIRQAESEDEFVVLLREIFDARTTRRIIQSIRAQVEPVDEELAEA
jgi:hypothetical protein